MNSKGRCQSQFSVNHVDMTYFLPIPLEKFGSVGVSRNRIIRSYQPIDRGSQVGPQRWASAMPTLASSTVKSGVRYLLRSAIAS